MRPALILALLLLPQDPEIDALIRKLGDDSIEAREKAAETLIGRGKAAEAALQKALPDLSEEQKARAEKILQRIQSDALLHKSLPPLQRFSVSAKDRPFREVAAELCRQAGVKMQEEGELEEKRVTVDVKDATLLEALEAVAASSKSSYTPARDPERIIFSSEPAEFIATRCVRHYRLTFEDIEISRVKRLRGETRSATLRFGLRSIPNVKSSLDLEFFLTAISDDKGRSLLPDPPDPTHGTFIDFKCPADDARSLSLIRGKIVHRYPGEIRKFSFPVNPPKAGQSLEFQGFTTELLSAERKGTDFIVKFRTWGPSQVDHGPDTIERWSTRLRLKDGTTAPSNGGRSSGSSDPKAGSLEETRFQPGEVEPDSVEIDFMLGYFLDSFEFEFKDIALPR